MIHNCVNCIFDIRGDRRCYTCIDYKNFEPIKITIKDKSMTENYVKPIRSELFYKILNIVKDLNLEKSDKDHYDHLSAAVDLEKLFLSEKPTTEKFIFENEEQAKIFLHEIFDHQTHRIKESDNSICDYIIDMMKQKGYIRKTELQTLVEEAEEIEKLCLFEHNPNEFKNIGMLIKTIQALKKEVIKLGGKI